MWARGERGIENIFFFNDTATTEIYTLSLHDALPILLVRGGGQHDRESGQYRDRAIASDVPAQKRSDLPQIGRAHV